jgi:RNA polymerase sigma-70 factor, ECF subfamily
VLVERIANGDVDAVDHLYSRHSGSVYALAYGRLMDSTAADLVVDETFKQVRQRASEFDPALGSAGLWLSTIARSCAQARRNAR